MRGGRGGGVRDGGKRGVRVEGDGEDKVKEGKEEREDMEMRGRKLRLFCHYQLNFGSYKFKQKYI